MIVARGGGSLADLFAFCDEALCRTVALLRVPVISSVGHHTDRTLIDDVAAVCCSTPTHAAEAAVPVDCGAARADTAAYARRLHGHGRRAILHRARALAALSRAPAQHVARHRRQLHQLLRELRASARRACEQGCELAGVHRLVLARSCERAIGADAARRRSELDRLARGFERTVTTSAARRRAQLDRLALALAAHDPQRTLARGYALVADRAGEPLASAAAARAAGAVDLRFHDGVVSARIEDPDRV